MAAAAAALLVGCLALSAPRLPGAALRLRGGEEAEAELEPVVLRIRTPQGLKRLRLSAGRSCTLGQLADELAAQHKISLGGSLVLSRRAAGAEPLSLDDRHKTLLQLGLEHGDFLHLCAAQPSPAMRSAPAEGAAASAGEGADGADTPAASSATARPAAVERPASSSAGAGARRAGAGGARRTTASTGPVKRTWQQIEDERKAKTVEMKAPPKPRTPFVAVDGLSARSFAEYAMSSGAYEASGTPRAAALYGRISPDDKGVRGVWVDVVHELPEEGTYQALAEADKLAVELGLVRVGAAFTHSPRQHKLDVQELIQLCEAARSARAGPASAELQTGRSAAAETTARPAGGAVPRRRVGGVVNAMSGELEKEKSQPPSFVCLLFRPVYADEDIEGLFTAEAFEPTAQCEELCRTGALVAAPTPGEAALAPSTGKSFKVEGKPGVKTVDTAYLAVRVFDSGRPHASPLRQRFPLSSRGAEVRKFHLRSFLAREAEAGVAFREVATDFAFLMHVSRFLPEATFRDMCAAIAAALRGKSLSPRQQQDAADAFATCARLCYAHAGLPPPAHHEEVEAELESPLVGCLAGIRRVLSMWLSKASGAAQNGGDGAVGPAARSTGGAGKSG